MTTLQSYTWQRRAYPEAERPWSHPWSTASKRPSAMKRESRTILIDLTKSEEELWNALHTKHRYNIRWGWKRGIVAQEGGDREACYRLYRSHCRNKLLHPSSRRSLFEDRQLYTASLDGELVAFCVVGPTDSENTVVIREGAALREKGAMEGNTVLLWHMLVCSKRKGLETLDLGGIDLHARETEGIDRYKMRWGGTLVESEIDVKWRKYIWSQYLRHSRLVRAVWYWKGVVTLKLRSE